MAGIATDSANLRNDLAGVSTKVASQSAILASQDSKLSTLDSTIASNSAQIAEVSSNMQSSIASTSASLASLQTLIDSILGLNPSRGSTPNDATSSAALALTPPDILTATGSAQLANLTVSDKISTLKLDVSDGIFNNSLAVYGNTNLASTNIAGDLVQDGTFSITGGNTINVTGPLYLQTSFLAGAVDLFNGLITLTPQGEIKANSVIVAEYKVVAGKTTGSGKILAGTNSVIITNPYVTSNSRILITPTVSTSQVLAVTSKIATIPATTTTLAQPGKFTVSSPWTAPTDLTFDYWIINESSE